MTFDSTHQAIHFERLLKPHFAIELIPTPREITASCGLSLKFECDDFEAIKEALDGEPYETLKLYRLKKTEQMRQVISVSWR